MQHFLQGWKQKQSCGLDHRPQLLALLSLRRPLKGKYILPMCLPHTWPHQHTFAMCIAIACPPDKMSLNCTSAAWPACTDMHAATFCRSFVHSSLLIVCNTTSFSAQHRFLTMASGQQGLAACANVPCILLLMYASIIHTFVCTHATASTLAKDICYMWGFLLGENKEESPRPPTPPPFSRRVTDNNCVSLCWL